MTPTATVTHTAQQDTQAIVDLVSQLPVDQSGGGSLTSTLDVALSQIAAGNTTPAVNQLNALVNKLNAQVRSGQLSAAQVQSAINATQALIRRLGG